MNLFVSACLLGEQCRYDGASSYVDSVAKICGIHETWSFCPECAGGLQTPRPPAEIVGNCVLTQTCQDVTHAFAEGALQAVASARKHSVDLAILKSKSPSCGTTCVYDGSFSGCLRPGEGIAAKALRESGFIAIDENHVNECASLMDKPVIVVGSSLLSATLAYLFHDDETAPPLVVCPNYDEYLRTKDVFADQAAGKCVSGLSSGLTLVCADGPDSHEYLSVLPDECPYYVLAVASDCEGVSQDSSNLCTECELLAHLEIVASQPAHSQLLTHANRVSLMLISTSPLLLELCRSYFCNCQERLLCSPVFYGGASAIKARESVLSIKNQLSSSQLTPRPFLPLPHLSSPTIVVAAQGSEQRPLNSCEIQVVKDCLSSLFEGLSQLAH